MKNEVGNTGFDPGLDKEKFYLETQSILSDLEKSLSKALDVNLATKIN